MRFSLCSLNDRGLRKKNDKKKCVIDLQALMKLADLLSQFARTKEEAKDVVKVVHSDLLLGFFLLETINSYQKSDNNRATIKTYIIINIETFSAR